MNYKVKKIGEGFLVEAIIYAHIISFLIAIIVLAIRDDSFYLAVFLVGFLAWLFYCIIYKLQKINILEDKIRIKSLRRTSFVEYTTICKVEYLKGTRTRSVVILYKNHFEKEAKLIINVESLLWEDIREFAIFVKSKNSNVDITAFED